MRTADTLPQQSVLRPYTSASSRGTGGGRGLLGVAKRSVGCGGRRQPLGRKALAPTLPGARGEGAPTPTPPLWGHIQLDALPKSREHRLMGQSPTECPVCLTCTGRSATRGSPRDPPEDVVRLPHCPPSPPSAHSPVGTDKLHESSGPRNVEGVHHRRRGGCATGPDASGPPSGWEGGIRGGGGV